MRLLAAAAALSASAFATAAAEPQQVATYSDWMVFTFDTDGGDRICYAVTEPQDVSPTSANHGDVFFSVASWRSGSASNQPSFMAGYQLQDSSEPMVRIGSDRWEMFSDEREAFIEAPRQEQRLIDAMRRGREMRVSATSARSTATNYTFSLIGISKALERVEEACS
ncbi:invasion associated locus B family protein [Parvularcula maris]|uniref:Invasion associated locus B family protein n=1 Tax=Parvularcula maris TaxID=2965077 RepID=A0A9X2RKH3_9PROT|nr:invasion associated locus B family protein [Parvularcula maris]MCQ8185778.1 invasion associated locus B family protein [Parvularcula maris]